MRAAFVIGILMGAVAAFAGGARWDGQYDLVAKSTQDGGDQQMTIPNGAYVKVECTADTRVSSVQRLSDAGLIPSPCLLSDAGYNCSSVKYSLGEKFYSLTGTFHNRVLTNASSGTCEVFVAR